MKQSRAQFFVKYCIQWPFVENMTARIKMWHFLESILSPLVGKKGDAGAAALNGGKSANQKCSSYTHCFHHSALLSGQPKVNWASMPSGLLAQLTTLRIMNMDPCLI